jgi:O-antigen ligase
LGWPFQVINGHNGFVDVFTYLGVIGLALFSVLTVQMLWRALSYAVKARSKEALWVVLTAVYVVLANLTISFFFQFETFHWILLVLVLFASMRSPATAPPVEPADAVAPAEAPSR